MNLFLLEDKMYFVIHTLALPFYTVHWKEESKSHISCTVRAQVKVFI